MSEQYVITVETEHTVWADSREHALKLLTSAPMVHVVDAGLDSEQDTITDYRIV